MFIKPEACLGVGINYRGEIAADIVKHLEKIDFIEINTERFFVNDNDSNLKQIIASTPIVLHGLSLSIGTENQNISQDYLTNLSHTLQKIDCEWFSEHIAITCVNGIEIRSLMPVEFTDESIERIVNNAKCIASLTKKPFILENITYYYNMPTSKMSEAYFIREIIERADCGLLLDLNNLYVNSINHRYDPYYFLDKLPLDRVVEIHLAGCEYMHDIWVDTHASSVSPEVIALFEYVCRKTRINGVVIERDAKLIHFLDLLEEVKIIRAILKKNNLVRQ